MATISRMGREEAVEKGNFAVDIISNDEKEGMLMSSKSEGSDSRKEWAQNRQVRQKGIFVLDRCLR